MSEEAIETIRIARGEALHVDHGTLRFSVWRSEIGDDGGHSIEVCRVPSSEDEPAEGLIRFDAFRNDPHYHLPSSQKQPTAVEAGYPGGGLAFAIDAIRERLPELLDRADHGEFARAAEKLPLSEIADEVRAAAERNAEPGEGVESPLTPQMREALGMEPTAS